LKKGSCGYVLPKHLNLMYVKITRGFSFGFIDIIHNIQKYTDINNEDWQNRLDKMQSQFTTMSTENTELLTLSIKDLKSMIIEFQEYYDLMFNQ